MKLKILSFLVVFVGLGCLSKVYALGSGTSAIGNILLKNGSQFDSVPFEMPLMQDKKVKVKINGKKQKLETDSIDCIILWNKKHPEEKHLFKAFRMEIMDLTTGAVTGVTPYAIWLCCEQLASNASYWIEVGRPSFRWGRLRFNFNSLYSYTSKYYVLKKGSEYPSHIPEKDSDVKKWARFYFSDDPEVSSRIENGEYNVSDWGYKSIDICRIIADYNPKRF